MRNIQDSSGGSAARRTNKCFPVEHATVPYWRSELHPIDRYRSTEEIPHECDVAIIGAGMAGVSIAYHLTKDLNDGQTAPSIVMLEAREVCSGATGRNGGHVKFMVSSIQRAIRNHGFDAAMEVLDLALAQIHALKKVVEVEDLDCEFELRRSFDVNLDKEDAESEITAFRKSLTTDERWTKEASQVSPKHCDQVTSMHNVKAAFSVPACSFWPYKFVSQMLARLIEREVVNLQTETTVKAITTGTDGANVLHTNRGKIRARKLVFATNAYTSGILPQYEGIIVPYRGVNSHIKPKTPITPHLSNTYNIRYSSNRVDYLSSRPDGGIVVGGAKWTFSSNRKKWYNNWDDSVTLEEARPHFENLMQTYFKGWEHSDAHVDHFWSGIMGLTLDEMPHVGSVPGTDNQYIMAGFNGGGMPLIFLSAKGLATMIRDGVSFEETGLPGLFKTTEERLKRKLPLE